MKKLFILILLLVLYFGCEKAEELISPYHYDILPKPQNFNIEQVIEDSLSKKIKVFLKWTFGDTTNLKNFEVYRSTKTPDNFRMVPPAQRNTIFVDSTLPIFNDSLVVFYKVFPNGFKTDPKTKVQTSFLGPESDTKQVTIRKKK